MATLTADSLIHNNAHVVDYNFVRRDKNYLLSRTQYWKNFLVSKNVKKIMMMQHNNVDSICIFFAAAELNIQIVVAPVDKENFLKYVDNVDLAITNKNFLYWTQKSKYLDVDLNLYKNLYFLDEQSITSSFQQENYVYSPDIIDPENQLVLSYTSGTTGNPKLVIHTSDTFFKGTEIASELYNQSDIFASHCSTNHIGMVAVTLLGPLYAGATIFTIQFIHELCLLAARGIFTKIFLYESNLTYHINKTFELPADCFKQTIVMTGGSVPSLAFVDDILLLGAAKLIILYGNNEGIVHQYSKELHSISDEIVNTDLGELTTNIKSKIKNETLWINSPSQSKYIATDSDGFFNTFDYVKNDQGKLFYLGRTKFITSQGITIFDSQLHKEINLNLSERMYHVEYFVDLDYNILSDCFNITLYPKSQRALSILNKSLVLISSKLKTIIKQSNLELTISNDIVDVELALTGIKNNIFDIKNFLQGKKHESTLKG